MHFNRSFGLVSCFALVIAVLAACSGGGTDGGASSGDGSSNHCTCLTTASTASFSDIQCGETVCREGIEFHCQVDGSTYYFSQDCSTSSSSTSSSSSGTVSSSSGSSGTSSSSSSSSTGGPAICNPARTFFCGDDECKEVSEACVYYDGKPFACQAITVNNQCNENACDGRLSYMCDHTNYPNATCSMAAGNPGQITVRCSP